VVRVSDVGRAELGTDLADLRALYNGNPAGVLAVRQEPGANALDTADRIRARLADLEKYFPAGMKVIYPSTPRPSCGWRSGVVRP